MSETKVAVTDLEAKLMKTNAALLAVLRDLTERAERARGILRQNSGGHWGMLDTETAKAVIADAEKPE